MARETGFDKDARRRELKAARAAIPSDERARIDGAIARNVIALPEYQGARIVLPYLSFGSEVDTRAIVEDAWAAGKTVALPRCVKGTRLMRWHSVSSFEGLVKSQLGVEEPADDPSTEIDPLADDATVVIVPGMEFDRSGYRLGYGGGFYDVFLSTFPGVSIGLCRTGFLQQAPIEHDGHDLPVNIVVTDQGALRTVAASALA